jgi:hypothetical protein
MPSPLISKTMLLGISDQKHKGLVNQAGHAVPYQCIGSLIGYRLPAINIDQRGRSDNLL